MRIVIHEEHCRGSGHCSEIAPGLVTTDALGQGVLRADGEVPAGLEDLARTAAAACPQGAIRCFDEL